MTRHWGVVPHIMHVTAEEDANHKAHALSITSLSSSLQGRMSSAELPLSDERCRKALESTEIDEDVDISDCPSPYWSGTSESDSDRDIPYSSSRSPDCASASDYSKEAVVLYDRKMDRARNRTQSTLGRERNLRAKDGLSCGIEPLEQDLCPSPEIHSSSAYHSSRRPRLRIFFRKLVVDWLLKVRYQHVGLGDELSVDIFFPLAGHALPSLVTYYSSYASARQPRNSISRCPAL